MAYIKSIPPQVNNLQDIEIHPDLAKGLKGGRKQFWLRVHRPEIEKCLDEKGPEYVCIRYNLRESTLKRFIERRYLDLQTTRMSAWDRQIMELAQIGDAELRGEIRKLKQWKAEVTPIIDAVKTVIAALGDRIENQLVKKSEVPEIDDDDPLSLKKLGVDRGDKAKLPPTSHNY